MRDVSIKLWFWVRAALNVWVSAAVLLLALPDSSPPFTQLGIQKSFKSCVISWSLIKGQFEKKGETKSQIKETCKTENETLNELSISIQGPNLHGKTFTVSMFTILWPQHCFVWFCNRNITANLLHVTVALLTLSSHWYSSQVSLEELVWNCLLYSHALLYSDEVLNTSWAFRDVYMVYC